MIDRDELGAWLRLLETPTVGRESARRLLAEFGSPQAVLDAGRSAQQDVAGPKAAAALQSSSADVMALVERTFAWLDADAAAPRDIVVLGDARYPAWLLETADPPLLLYGQGRIELLQADSLAIVGSRNPTPQGLENARAFAAHLSQAGLVIVSGMALGIDGAAHDGALEGGAGTIAVVGTGLDVVYPRSHRQLAHRIAERGLMLSEYAVGAPSISAHFPVRNRIIAGLSRGTLVVEAALQSGSLITARLAIEAGRDVFAIPGSIHSPLSRGCHQLIKQGAKLVDSANDVLEELQGAYARPIAQTPRTTPPVDATDDVGGSRSAGDALLATLGFEPMALDELVARTGESVAVLSARLLDLELDGKVSRLPGQKYQRVVRL